MNKKERITIEITQEDFKNDPTKWVKACKEQPVCVMKDGKPRMWLIGQYEDLI